MSQKNWAVSQGTTQKTVVDLIKVGCKVDEDGRVWRPTKYTVPGAKNGILND